VNSNSSNDFNLSWTNNFIKGDGLELTTLITRITKLSHFLASMKDNTSYFSWPGSWVDKNDGVFLRTPFHHKGRVINHGYKNQYFAQCWCLKNGESDAMWRLYASDPNNSVMIQSSINLVMNSLWKGDESLTRLFFGKVQYVPIYQLMDPSFFDREINGMQGLTDTSGGGPPLALMYKSNVYDHEQELRIVYRHESEETSNGILVQHHTPFRNLVNCVILHPESNEVFRRGLRAVLDDMRVSVNIEKSRVFSQSPSYYNLS